MLLSPRPLTARLRGLARRLRRDDRALALIEFALISPIVLSIGAYGIELSNLALMHLRVSHAAIDAADNAARVGTQNNSTGIQTLTETDLNDVIQGLRVESAAWNLTTYGRVTISSVEAVTDSSGNTTQFLHWQRCVGLKSGANFDSTYGTAPTDDSGKTVTGIGSPQLTAPKNSGLIFVEVNYNYQPLFGSLLMQPRTLHYIAAMIVRQTRSPSDSITNPASATRMTCDKYTV